jgi:hypothetical protein
MRTLEVIIIIFFLFSYTAYSQKQTPSAYKDSVTKVLKQRTDIADFFFDEEYHSNKQLAQQKLYVKYKTDSIDRYFQVGQCFHYRRNGMLMQYHEIDINTLIETGLLVTYNKKGEIKWSSEDRPISSSELAQLDSSSYIDIKNYHFVNYWICDSVKYFEPLVEKKKGYFLSRALPTYYIVIAYNDGCKKDHSERWYDRSKREYIDIRSKSIYYGLNPKKEGVFV